jgi:hypothetical protein
MAANQFARGLKTTDAWHLDVHENNVRLQFAGFYQRFFTRLSLANHTQTVDIRQHTSDASTYKVVVINNEYPDQASPRFATAANVSGLGWKHDIQLVIQLGAQPSKCKRQRS